ncbi:MAG TPA: type II toxin-antitoxin system VapC family toxin [Actinomycetota bacterium]
MRVVVADASALLEYLLVTEAASAVGSILRLGDADLHAPALCDVEVVAGLRRAVLRGSLSDRRAAEAVEDYLDLPLTRHGHQGLLGRILELRANFSAYDATYVALAETMQAELLTLDARLSSATRTHTAIGVVP